MTYSNALFGLLHTYVYPTPQPTPSITYFPPTFFPPASQTTSISEKWRGFNPLRRLARKATTPLSSCSMADLESDYSLKPRAWREESLCQQVLEQRQKKSNIHLKSVNIHQLITEYKAASFRKSSTGTKRDCCELQSYWSRFLTLCKNPLQNHAVGVWTW